MQTSKELQKGPEDLRALAAPLRVGGLLRCTEQLRSLGKAKWTGTWGSSFAQRSLDGHLLY